MKTFMHYRKFNRLGQVMGKGGLTLAIQCEGNQISVGMAHCSTKDNFNKKLGRTVAEGRLRNRTPGFFHTMTLPEETSVKSFVHNQEVIRKQVQRLLAGG